MEAVNKSHINKHIDSSNSRDDIIPIQTSHGDHVGRVCGEEDCFLAQRSPGDVHQILEVVLVVEATEAILILNLQRI